MKKISAVIAGMLALLIIVSGVSPVFASAATAGTSVKIIISYDGANIAKSTATSLKSKSVVLTGTKFDVRSADGKTTYGTYEITDSMFASATGNAGTLPITITVPEWTTGSQYQIVFTNPPAFLVDAQAGKATHTIEYVLDQYATPDDSTLPTDPSAIAAAQSNSAKKAKAEVVGVDYPASVDLQTDRSTARIYVTNSNGVFLKGENVTLTQLSSSDKEVRKDTITTDSAGLSAFAIQSTTQKVRFGVTNKANGYTATHTDTVDLNDTYSGVEYTYVVNEATPKDRPGLLTINASLKNKYATDIFTQTPLEIAFKNGSSVSQTTALDKFGVTDYNQLLPGVAYTASAASGDYSFTDKNLNLSANTKTVWDLAAQTKYALKVVDYVGDRYQFPDVSAVKSKTYSNTETFDANSDRVYSVKDIKKNVSYSVFISPDYAMAVLDLATGKVSYDGKFNGKDNETNGVPKTGDLTYLWVAGSIIVAGVLLIAGFWVFHKRNTMSGKEG